MYFLVKGSGKRYIVCGNSLPFFLIGSMLLAQSLDANATMGNSAGAYGAGFWSGFQFPLGLALCLILTGLFFAKPLNKMKLMTLPDFYARRYGSSVEVLVSLLMSFSFAILVAGNFAGSAWIISMVFEIDYTWALIFISIFILVYTVAGGLYSSAATDIVQIYPAIFGFVGCAFWLYFHYGWDFFSTAIPENYLDLSGLMNIKDGALLNWAGIAALAFGDIVALDFMERIFAAKNPDVARKGCFFGAALTLVTGVACSFIGLMSLKMFPGLTDSRMVLPNMAMLGVPFLFGLFIMGGIIGAGASTANGGILGVSTVMGRNLLQKNILPVWNRMFHGGKAVRVTDRKLLFISRCMAFPVVAFAIYLAHVKPEPGILLVLAFDVVFAGCLVPLVLGIYWKKANAPGALAAVIVGTFTRLVLYFYIPEHLAGLDTLISPVVALIAMVSVSLVTQEQHASKYEVIYEQPDEDAVLAGL
ncbi:MAG: hypothetical protein PHQ97_14700 [Desulfobacterales bacterium]|nr:hypothetical protein [Desulfobacterales bacterium]